MPSSPPRRRLARMFLLLRVELEGENEQQHAEDERVGAEPQVSTTAPINGSMTSTMPKMIEAMPPSASHHRP